MPAIQGYLGAVYVKTGASTSFTNQYMLPVGNLMEYSDMNTDGDSDGVVSNFFKLTSASATTTWSLDTTEQAQKIDVTASTGAATPAVQYQPFIAVVPGQQYSLSCDVKAANILGSGTGVRISVDWFDASNNFISSSISSTSTSTTWTRLKLENITAPANAVKARPACTVKINAAGNTCTGWFKNIQFEARSTATSYAAGPTKTYQIGDSTKRYWDTTQPVTVQTSTDNTTWTTVSSGFQIEYCGGRLVFDNKQTDKLIRVSASSYPVSEEANMFNWELEIERDAEDVPTFGSGWNVVIPTLASISGKAEWYWGSNKFFQRLGDKEMVFVLYTDRTYSRRYELYGSLTKQKIETPVDGIVTEELEFKANGKVYYREG